ncbi:MAG: aminotransferase class V-fold PLP-dependent enzyme [Chloroflexota bacterium]
MDDATAKLLRETAQRAIDYLSGLDARHVGATRDAGAIADRLRHLPESGEAPAAVVAALADAVEDGLVASAGPRYFGFVIGGAVPVSVAADWLTAAWDQNSALHALSPAAAAAEQVAGEWMLDLLGLPADWSFGLPTGAGLGNAVGLAAGRHAILANAGWDVETKGLYGAPEIEVIVGAEAHATALSALQYLGLGRDRVNRIPVDDQGAMRADAFAAALAGAADRPVLVSAQAGNVNTGAFDPLPAIADACATHTNVWLHVDGAFGAWAAVSPRLQHLVEDMDRADSVSTDAHKWLNVGYDCGFIGVRDQAAHRAAMTVSAAYLMPGSGKRDGWEYVLDSSRRSRGFALYATIRSLGRSGVRELVERCCDLAVQLAQRLAAVDGIEVLNEVVLNQVLVRFGGDDARTNEVIRRVQEDGTAWMGGTVWQGKAAMRISVSNWSTTPADIDQTADAIIRAFSG